MVPWHKKLFTNNQKKYVSKGILYFQFQRSCSRSYYQQHSCSNNKSQLIVQFSFRIKPGINYGIFIENFSNKKCNGSHGIRCVFLRVFHQVWSSTSNVYRWLVN